MPELAGDHGCWVKSTALLVKPSLIIGHISTTPGESRLVCTTSSGAPSCSPQTRRLARSSATDQQLCSETSERRRTEADVQLLVSALFLTLLLLSLFLSVCSSHSPLSLLCCSALPLLLNLLLAHAFSTLHVLPARTNAHRQTPLSAFMPHTLSITPLCTLTSGQVRF